ncbi:MAG: hypothetical protein Q9198_003763 [Flavoplaca austrocitrina]
MNILKKSDESANTIVPSRLSSVTPSLWGREDDSVVSEVSESSLVYRELAIDDDLFTTRVYKRNYRVKEVQEVEPKAKTESPPNKALRNFSRPGIVYFDGIITRLTKPTTTMVPRFSIMPSQAIQEELLPEPGSSQIVTGWLVLSDFDDRYTAIPGPKVSKIFFDGEGLSEWKMSLTKYPKLDCDYWLSTIEELFHSFVDKPIEWLHHCVMAASAVDRGNVVRMILEEDPDLFSKALGFHHKARRHPVELAFQHGHVQIVKDLLQSSDLALYNRYAEGKRMIRHAIHNHDPELLSLILMQNSFSYYYPYDDGNPMISLENPERSDLCLASIIEASAGTTEISADPDRSALRLLTPALPQILVMVARLPLSVVERKEIIKTFLVYEAFARCSHHGFVWKSAFDKVVRRIANYLMLRNDSIYLGEVSVETHSRLNKALGLHFGEIARRRKVKAALRALV